MDTGAIQRNLFQVIKSRLPSDASLADEVAALLDISIDSAYRRMRSEKPLTFDELYKLSVHYRISIDELMHIHTAAFLFQGNLLNSKDFGGEDHFRSMVQILSHFNSFKNKEFYYLCKDVPIFYHFLSRDIAAFKYFFWMKTIFDFPGFANQSFSFDAYPADVSDTGEKILEIYNQIPSVEFWNVENINIGIRQVEFYRDSRMFDSDRDALRIYEAWEKVIDHLKSQAELGYKYKYGDAGKIPISPLKVYFNEVILGDNSMMAILDGAKSALMPHTVINYMVTRDVSFCENMYGYIQRLARRSTLISEVSEKERSKFFRILKERIQVRKDALRL
ncbi:MAG TPA: hypothetical protein VD993_19010 [Chitinophagaceae bacterium]|nr:hypothetical protein [Chitinophagaceae bacterium]